MIPFPLQTGGLGRRLSAAEDVWTTFTTWTPTSNSPGWAGYTFRNVIDASLTPSASKLRFTLSNFSFGGFTVKNMYVGIKAAAGDAYDFDATPTQVTFNGGNSGATVASGATIVTDTCVFSLADAQGLVVAVAFVDAVVALSAIGTIPSVTGWSGFYKLGDDTTTVNATGYTTSVPSLVTKIEYVA